MRLPHALALLLIALLDGLGAAQAHHNSPSEEQQQQRLPIAHHDPDPAPPYQDGVSPGLFASLERTARLVDIAYCVGTPPGVRPPFACPSRCGDFPTVRLLRTWNTGPLLSDSCGYIAVDHAPPDGDGRPAIVVAFRGTYSLANTIVDLSTVPQEYVPYPPPGDGDNDGDDGGGRRCENCTVHMGFMMSWRNARREVVPALRAARARYPGSRVHLMGHSLGGAVAALAALELRLGLGWGDDVVVTTFGEPRVGNAELVAYLDRAFGLDGDSNDGGAGKDGRGTDAEQKWPYRRVTHVGDPVPLLPLTEWGYRPHAGEVYIAKPDLPPGPQDLRLCRGDNDPACIGGAEKGDWLSRVVRAIRGLNTADAAEEWELEPAWFPSRLKLWQLLFAHRDYFWRLGLCVPGGDPADWGREKYNVTWEDESEMQDL